jgi:hypothetical protein
VVVVVAVAATAGVFAGTRVGVEAEAEVVTDDVDDVGDGVVVANFAGAAVADVGLFAVATVNDEVVDDNDDDTACDDDDNDDEDDAPLVIPALVGDDTIGIFFGGGGGIAFDAAPPTLPDAAVDVE